MIIHKISRLFFAGMRIATPLLLIGALCALVNIYDPACLNSITTAIKHHPMEYRLFRWGALCAFILCWPYIVLKIGQHRGVTLEQISHWRKETWRIGLWLIMIELLVCENLISKTIHLLGGL